MFTKHTSNQKKESALIKKQNNHWVCYCGKLYCSYSSFYQHSKKKHPLPQIESKPLKQSSAKSENFKGRPSKYEARNKIDEILDELSDSQKYYLREIYLPFEFDQECEGDRNLRYFMTQNGQIQEARHLLNHFCWKIKEAVFLNKIFFSFWAQDAASFPLLANCISEEWANDSMGMIRNVLLNKVLEVYCRWMFEKRLIDMHVSLRELPQEVEEKKNKNSDSYGGENGSLPMEGEEQIGKYLS